MDTNTITFDRLFSTPKEQTMQKQASPCLADIFLSSMEQSFGAGQPIQKQASAPTQQNNEAELGKQAAREINEDLDNMCKAAAYAMVNEEYQKLARAERLGRMYAHGVWNGIVKAAELDGVQMKRDKPETQQGAAADTKKVVEAPTATMGEGIAYLASHMLKKPVGQVSAPSDTDGPNKIVQTTGDGFNA
jgi:hypothetical protein